ncbi:uncharacterized protein PHALS_08941 [Plasmopara halstedii]|uniref:Uncharacterized protein n=1 Tax=Plasmopara halstedii TaxID=4781 RepID=A0A0P1AD12_PLAHL|nr:uncharacterized protein PHALS_08941 [Plasmopara halstedii]CEG38895.1 hypothetical protein PHALS_08941 [Plasmopara halstedii]|eukprot:XP_024575264.1 hypothetical protein PHALS_08941 [Plasmopara halstedii]
MDIYIRIESLLSFASSKSLSSSIQHSLRKSHTDSATVNWLLPPFVGICKIEHV